MKGTVLRTAVLLTVVAALLGPGAAADAAKTSGNTFIVVGTGIISKQDVTTARQQAIANSLVSAVGLVAAELLTVEAMVDNHEKLNAIVYTQTGKYVQDYKVLTEGAFGDQYRVMVQASVSRNALKNQLSRAGVIRAHKTMPRVLFFLSEQDLQEPYPRYWWGQGMPYSKPVAESAIAEVMREQNFKIIEHGPRVQRMATAAVTDSADIGPEEAVNLGKALNADVVVIGTALAEAAPNVMGSSIRSFKGLINARAYRTKTGDQLAAVTRTAVAANVDEQAGGRDALRGSGSLVGEQLAIDIEDAWQKEKLEADKIEVALTGTRNLANFVMFRRMLNTVEGVEGIAVQELKADTATLKVAYKGSARELANSLMLRAFDTFGINIYEVGEDNLKIQLISHAPAAQN
ncbi:MAG: hypothetical protein AMJ54_12895 [Deltaproteobacteria bacterium SG8_13]|nr:MAG: hypothetical protein AMJ54_12895 [Deltaproteobacteria bacterium SG8_13]